MKSLVTLRLYCRDAMDRETLVPLGSIEFPAAGDGTVILSRDAMGLVCIDNCEIQEDKDLSELLAHATKSLECLHTKMGETSIASQHALTDMFAVHKWLTR